MSIARAIKYFSVLRRPRRIAKSKRRTKQAKGIQQFNKLNCTGIAERTTKIC